MSVSQRRQTHPLHLFNQQRNVVDSLCNDVGDFMQAQSLAQSGIYLQIWANRERIFGLITLLRTILGGTLSTTSLDPPGAEMGNLVGRDEP
jgi:hypothetical protein